MGRFPAFSEKSGPERSWLPSTCEHLSCPLRIWTHRSRCPGFTFDPLRTMVQGAPLDASPFLPFPRRGETPVSRPLPSPRIPIPLPPIDIFRSRYRYLPFVQVRPFPSGEGQRESGDEATRVTFEVASRVRAAWASARLRSRRRKDLPRGEVDRCVGAEAGGAGGRTMWREDDGMDPGLEVRRWENEGRRWRGKEGRGGGRNGETACKMGFEARRSVATARSARVLPTEKCHLPGRKQASKKTGKGWRKETDRDSQCTASDRRRHEASGHIDLETSG